MPVAAEAADRGDGRQMAAALMLEIAEAPVANRCKTADVKVKRGFFKPEIEGGIQFAGASADDQQVEPAHFTGQGVQVVRHRVGVAGIEGSGEKCRRIFGFQFSQQSRPAAGDAHLVAVLGQ